MRSFFEFMRHYYAGVIIAASLVLPSITLGFEDTQYHFFRESIESLSASGIVSGYDSKTFGPQNPITRAELLKILLAKENIELEMSTSPCFADISSESWQQDYVCTAKTLGYTKGYPDGSFRPNQSVTTLEALTLISRVSKIALSGSGSEQEDIRAVFDEKGIIPSSQYTDTTEITRGLAADVIVRSAQAKTSDLKLQTLSSGCEKGEGLTSGTKTLKIAGKERSYILALPSGYDAKKAYRLIVAIHGRTNSNAQVQKYMGLEKGNTESIIAYPAGLSSGKSYSWSEIESVTFVDAIIQDISQKSCIDRSKISAVGHSLGGWFANKLTCLRAETFRSMTAVGSYGYQGACTGPVASLILQRKDDTLSPYSEGVKARDYRRDQYACEKDPTPITLAGNSCLQWSCGKNNPIIWCENYATYGNDPHSWPKMESTGIYEFINSVEKK